jgi:hypothetical protein
LCQFFSIFHSLPLFHIPFLSFLAGLYLRH